MWSPHISFSYYLNEMGWNQQQTYCTHNIISWVKNKGFYEINCWNETGSEELSAAGRRHASEKSYNREHFDNEEA